VNIKTGKRVINIILIILLALIMTKPAYASGKVNSHNNSAVKITSNSDSVKQVTIRMVGDILLHDGVEKSCRQKDGSYDYDVLFANTIDLIESADLAIVNEEVIIGGEELGVTGYPSFNAPYELADSLYDAGFDVICHGTNHALDRGKKGINNCLNYWEETYPEVKVLGIYNSQESHDEVYITKINGIKIAVLNYTYGTNGIAPPKDMPYAVSFLNEKEVIEDIEYAEKNADFTIVCPHWGSEYRLEANSEQKRLAQLMVEKGADLIIGTHPHVLEPVIEIKTENGNEAVCYYSLGNFINYTSGKGQGVANRMVGGMSQTTIEKRNGKVSIIDYELIPLVSHAENQLNKTTTYLLSDYTEELANNNAIKKQDPNFSLDYCRDLVIKVMDSKQ